MANAAATLDGRKGRHKRQIWFGTGCAIIGVVGLALHFGLSQAPGSPEDVPPAQEQVMPASSAATKIHDTEQANAAPAAPGLDRGKNELDTGEIEPAGDTAADDPVPALIAEAQAALERKDWQLAAAKAREVSRLTPEDAAAREILGIAEQEQANALLSRELDETLKNGDFERAESKLAALPDTSVYRQPAKTRLARARDKHKTALQNAISQGEIWRDAGKCDDIQALMAAWFEIEQELMTLHQQCQQAQQEASARAASNANAARSTPTRVAPASPAPAQKPASSGNGFNQLLGQAQEAAKRRSWTEARRLCKQALELQPKEPRAIEICTVAACNQNNAALAKGYYAKLPASRQASLHRLCLAKGIDLAR